MAATTFTSIMLGAFAVVLLTIASYAWLGDWEPRPRRTRVPQDRLDGEVEALRRAIEAYERDHRA